MKIYLDLCVYNRPFDDQHQLRIVVETLEFIFLLGKVIDGEIVTINSFVLEDENSKNPSVDRKAKIADFLEIATEYVDYDKSIENNAKQLESYGIMAMDALHIACAKKARADFFVTCDDLLVKKWEKNKEKVEVKVVSLMEFITKEVFKL